jgi:hypothetical protein
MEEREAASEGIGAISAPIKLALLKKDEELSWLADL